MKYGTEQGDFLGQEKLTYDHTKTNFGPDQGDILGQEKSILGLFKMKYGTEQCFFWGTGEVDIWVITR
jgi:hypothetical protein